MPIESNQRHAIDLAYAQYMQQRNIDFGITPLSSDMPETIDERVKTLEDSLERDFGISMSSVLAANQLDTASDIPSEEFIMQHCEAQPNTRKFYLLQQYHFHLNLRRQININAKSLLSSDSTEAQSGEKRAWYRGIFDIAKKIVDSLDDIWALLRSFISPELFSIIGFTITAGVGAIIHMAEAYQGGKEAYRAVTADKNKLGQRKTRFTIGASVLVTALVGLGLSIALFIGSVGVTVAGMAIWPVLIPSLLGVIYGLGLIKRSYVLHQAKAHEKNMYKLYEETLLAFNDACRINPKGKRNEETDRAVMNCYEQLKLRIQDFDSARIERIKAERHVAFNTLEVTASLIVLAGTILSVLAITSAFTFGAAPFILIIVGMLLGFAVKTADYHDEKHEFAITRQYRCNITNTWEKLTKSFNRHAYDASATKTSPKTSPTPAASQNEKTLKAEKNKEREESAAGYIPKVYENPQAAPKLTKGLR